MSDKYRNGNRDFSSGRKTGRGDRRTFSTPDRNAQRTRDERWSGRPDRARQEKAAGEAREDIVIGRNAVREALRAGTPAEALFVKRGERGGPVSPLVAECLDKKIPVKEVAPEKLDFMCAHGNHQGVILAIAAREYSTVDDILANAEEKGEDPFIIICDEIEDPHNLGAIIRSAEAAGAHGVIIPARNSAGLSYIVGKASAGALEYMPVARVTNLSACIRDLQSRGVWVWAADMSGTPYYEADLTGSVALIIGNEGKGVGRLVGETADGSVSIPMSGKINSLNASVAAGILMFEIEKLRRQSDA